MASLKGLSLAQQVAQLAEATPLDWDPEAFEHERSGTNEIGAPAPGAGAGSDEEEDAAQDEEAARAHYLHVGPSALRTANGPQSVSDPKYDGVRTSRSRWLDGSDLDPDSHSGADLGSGSDSDSEEHEEEEGQHTDDHTDEDGDEVGIHPGPPQDLDSDRSMEGEGLEDELSAAEEEAHQDEDEEGQGRSQGKNTRVDPQTVGPDLPSSLRQKREEDIRKGNAVSRQLALYDALLDARIRLQKSAIATNTLPLPADVPHFASQERGLDALNGMLHEALALSRDLLDLQQDLLEINGEALPPRKKPRTERPDHDRDGSHDRTYYAQEVQETTRELFELERVYHPHLVQTLNKWSAKVQAVAPSVLLPPARNAFSARRAPAAASAAKLVDEALEDRARVLGRTRVLRSGRARVGMGTGTGRGSARVGERGEGGDEEEEVFDDTDFYQQLLRDVIDARSSASGAGAGSGGADWTEAQKKRKARRKSEVDTRASKGRKLRYEVHEKLQNFMVPVPVPGAWHEEQIDELFASLLGNTAAGVGVGARGHSRRALQGEEDREDLEQEEEERSTAAPGPILDGFRVFG